MKTLLTGLLVLVGMVSAAHAAGGDAAAGGQKIAVCTACHGADGNSMLTSFPKLAGQGQKYLIKQMIDIKAGTRNVVEMTGLLTPLNEQDFADIAAYYSSQKPSGGVAKADLVEKGKGIYRAGNMATGLAACSACHSPTGTGNVSAVFPALAGQHADYIASQLKKFRSGERVNDGESRMMRDIAAKLTDAEILAVSSYIQGLR
ncbi:MAG: cytochrome c4 [Proteobacteria bacterium]|nr:MAG: cytochrome c4 [Pseudomonadota bacterium]